MRKSSVFVFSLLLAFVCMLGGCASTDPVTDHLSDRAQNGMSSNSDAYAVVEAADPDDAQREDIADASGILVAYFSRPGENYNVGVVEKGNTAMTAELIAQETGGDLFEIQTVTPYPESYDECTDIAKQEQEENARPELTASVDNWDAYDTVFLGYPIWWGDMPMALYTFMESYDWSGKTVIPFNTHEGSGLAGTAESIAQSCTGADVLEGIAIRGEMAQTDKAAALEIVTEWLEGLDLPDIQ